MKSRGIVGTPIRPNPDRALGRKWDLRTVGWDPSPYFDQLTSFVAEMPTERFTGSPTVPTSTTTTVPTLNTQTPFTTNPDDIKTVITITEIIKINVYYDIYARNIVIIVRKKWLAIKFKHLLPSRMSLEAPWRQTLNKSVRYKKELLLKVEKKPARELCAYFLGELLYLGLWDKFVELRTYKTILVDVTKLHKKIKRR